MPNCKLSTVTNIHWICLLHVLLALLIRTVTTINTKRLPCMRFDCGSEQQLSSPTLQAKCSDCSQCHANARRFCLLSGGDQCQCADSIPKSCIPTRTNNPLVICYVPAKTVLRRPDLSADDESSITIEIGRFWENEDENIHFRNLTLNAIYAVKDLIDCTDHGRFAKAHLIKDNLCLIQYRIPMPSIDYTSDDEYYYDDHQNPMVQFDRDIFDFSEPLIFWHSVRARRYFRLPLNVTVFFQYPMISQNITYTIPSRARGTPTIRSVPLTELLSHQFDQLDIPDFDVDNSDAGHDDDDYRLSNADDNATDSDKSDGGGDSVVKYQLFKKHYSQLVILSIALILFVVIICSALIWLCCWNDEKRILKKTRSHNMYISGNIS